ncbi:MAG: SDR family NAD(P)-dependent oxidoreductase [Candidatus Rokubacteria bacterium]|nr:SDR family NAD(P)-dependent oxidoreductase [Candidatus Rokubacteria bacterium]
MRFSGRVVIVTGAAVEATAKCVREAGADALAFRTDAAASAAVRTMVDAVVARWQRVDVLVNNARARRQRRPGDGVGARQPSRSVTVTPTSGNASGANVSPAPGEITSR